MTNTKQTYWQYTRTTDTFYIFMFMLILTIFIDTSIYFYFDTFTSTAYIVFYTLIGICALCVVSSVIDYKKYLKQD